MERRGKMAQLIYFVIIIIISFGGLFSFSNANSRKPCKSSRKAALNWLLEKFN